MFAPLGDFIDSKSGDSKIIKGKQSASPRQGLVPGYSASGQDIWVEGGGRYVGDGIVISAVGARCGKTFLASGEWTAIANTHVLRIKDGAPIDIRWLWYLTNNESFWIKSGTAQPFVTVKATLERDQWIPSIEQQYEIVERIESALAITESAKASILVAALSVKALKRSVLSSEFSGRYAINSDMLGNFLTVKYGKDVPREERADSGSFPVVGSAGVMCYTERFLTKEPAVLVGRKGNVGSVQLFPDGCHPVDTAYFIEVGDGFDPEFLYFQLQSIDLKALDSSTAIPSLRRQDLEAQVITKPSMQEQRAAVERIKQQFHSAAALGTSIDEVRGKLESTRRSVLNKFLANPEGEVS